jgi:hypothetical protein
MPAIVRLMGSESESPEGTSAQPKPDETPKPDKERKRRRPNTWEEPLAMGVLLLILVGVGLFIWRTEPSLVPLSAAPVPPSGASCPARPSVGNGTAVRVSDSPAAIDVYVGSGGEVVTRQSSPLAIQGKLPPGTPLCTINSDFVSTSGQVLPAYQVASWAVVDNVGTHVIVYVAIAPRHESISGFGGYTGTVSLNDPRAVGANVSVDANVEFYNVRNPLAWAMFAAFGGLIWAWFIHRHLSSNSSLPFLSAFILGVAVLIVGIVPVINAQVLSNPDWAGTLGQVLTLMSLSGGAAIAAAPTLRLVTTPPRSNE